MSERLSSWGPKNFEARGIPSKNLSTVYRRWGEGGFGVILTGNIMIACDQLESAGNLIIPPDAPFDGERFEAFTDLAVQGKKHGSLVVGQPSHPGRQISDIYQKNPVSASAIQLKGTILGMNFAEPHAATQEEIDEIVEAFAHAAEYLERAGFDGIELHGAHGYLLAQFLSPATNTRTDKHGGSLENRSRIIFEVAEAIRKRVQPDFVVGIKLNSVEFQDHGFTLEEARQLCVQLENHAFDFVELSGGTYEGGGFQHQRDSTRKREPVLKRTKSYITGGFKTSGAMVRALSTTDGVGLARTIATEPHLCKDILGGKVQGAVKQNLDDDNFGLTNIAAGTQIHLMGKSLELIDLSQEPIAQAFMKDMGTWIQGKMKDSELQVSGYVDVLSVPTVPYGTIVA